MTNVFSDLHRADTSPGPMPSVLALGRQIVRLTEMRDEVDAARADLKNQGLEPPQEFFQDSKLERRMQTLWKRECDLVDVTLSLRTHTLGDVAVMLGLAWRVLDIEAGSQHDEDDILRAFKQIGHALLTSLDVVIRETGLDLEEVVGAGTQAFIDREHADLGDSG